jgi:2-oxoglutarate ferredoxin oxidoreductase subunit alpha
MKTLRKKEPRAELVQGNEACAEGAIAAGCRFFAGYPITPSSEIPESLSIRLPQVDGVYIQMEDEIASMGAIIGASLAGAKSMTATSGPGFSLMQENLGYACIAEVPCVVVNVMRGGPSTGLPTYPAQGDVMQARWGTHGDHPIIALCPSSVGECFTLTVKAFNYSEKYRTPVILLMDEVVGHMREKVVYPEPGQYEIIDRVKPSVPPEWYLPYEDTSFGVPPMGIFGEGYRYHVTGLIHDIRGFPTLRQDEIEPFLLRLFRKISTHFDDIQMVESHQVEDADLVLIAYGCVARSAHRAMVEARAQGLKVGLMRLITIWPFPRRFVEPLTKAKKTLLVPEMNMGQISREVKRVNQGMTDVLTLNKIDGTIIYPQEILARIREEMKK